MKIEDHQFELVPFLLELTNIKTSQESRKVGNKILFSVAAAIGEQGLDQEITYIKMMKGVFFDNNYNLRREGILFLKRYFEINSNQSFCQSDRFTLLYLPEALNYLEDGDQQMACDAVQAISHVIEYIETDVITKTFMP